MKRQVRFVLALGSALFTALVLGSPASAQASGTQVQPNATVGIVSPSVNVPLGPQPAAQARSHGARRIPGLSVAAPATATPTTAPTSIAPTAATAPTVAAPLSQTSPSTAEPTSLLANFNGVSSLDSALTNFGAQFEPPDQGLCVGNGYVVEMVNSAYTVYRPNGSVVAGPFNVNGPFHEGPAEFTSDPRCYYDAATHTWFATILFISADSTTSSLDVAVNNSSDPTKAWTSYKIDTTGKNGPGHSGCPCFGDQPRLGIDAENLYVSTDEFSIQSPDFNGAQIYAIAKRDLVSLSSRLHFVHFDNLNIGGAPAFSVQPALTTGSSPAEYFLNSIDPSQSSDQRIGVWAMTDRDKVAGGGKPKLSSLVLPSEPFGVPPNASQKGGISSLLANNDGMQQVQFIDGRVWGELGTAVTIPGDSVQRAGAAWFQVQPVIGNGVITSARIQRQGYVAVRGNYLLYPALQVTTGGSAAMVMTLSGDTIFPSAAYAVLPSQATSFGRVHIAAPGSTHYNPKLTDGLFSRWGDYSWAILDPSGSSVWLATEYVPPKSSQTTNGLRNWGTRVFNVRTDTGEDEQGGQGAGGGQGGPGEGGPGGGGR